MKIKGFGSYTTVERHLATLSADEKNELYMSGELDRMLDETESNLMLNKGIAINEDEYFAFVDEDEEEDEDIELF